VVIVLGYHIRQHTFRLSAISSTAAGSVRAVLAAGHYI